MIQIARGQNKHADSLEARVNVSNVVVSKPCWMDPIVDFLAEDHLPNNEKEAERIHRTATRFWLSKDRKLYQRSFGGLYL